MPIKKEVINGHKYDKNDNSQYEDLSFQKMPIKEVIICQKDSDVIGYHRVLFLAHNSLCLIGWFVSRWPVVHRNPSRC